MGRREALEALYALYVDRVHAVALRILQRPEDAEEVVLDTFSQAWERAALYVPERGEVAAWLLNIARSRALDRLRAERRHRAPLPLHPEDASEPYPEHADDPSQRLFDQLDADSLPDYEVLDPILEAYVEQDLPPAALVERGFPEDVVRRIIGMVDRAEYKRRQAPPGIKTTPRAFGRDRRMPITNRYGDR